eukprot:TRINITY_DN6638_c0_g3_i2.p1 TRINITY_DN6638_c0_g3~~TRINITY_DN6638_c0_g3_i2.p1  ORF type:complete len:232 (-),score=63.41 TRINITY_DN6638_c0_g3_i2:389-1084(-)
MTNQPLYLFTLVLALLLSTPTHSQSNNTVTTEAPDATLPAVAPADASSQAFLPANNTAEVATPVAPASPPATETPQPVLNQAEQTIAQSEASNQTSRESMTHLMHELKSEMEKIRSQHDVEAFNMKKDSEREATELKREIEKLSKAHEIEGEKRAHEMEDRRKERDAGLAAHEELIRKERDGRQKEIRERIDAERGPRSKSSIDNPTNSPIPPAHIAQPENGNTTASIVNP